MSHKDPYMPNYDHVVRQTYSPRPAHPGLRRPGYIEWSEFTHTELRIYAMAREDEHHVVIHHTPMGCPTWTDAVQCRCMVEPL